jgi:hypothetical protein
MSGSTDLSQFNPGAANIENDATYQTDTLRTGGAVSGPWPPQSANKTLYQFSTFMRAFAVMMANKNYSMVDGTSPFQADASSNAAVTAMATVLANVITNFDLTTILASLLSAYSFSPTPRGYVKFSSAIQGLILQWGTTGSGTANTPQTITFTASDGIAFVNNPPVVIMMPTASSPAAYYLISTSLTNFIYEFGGSSGQTFFWFAIGN